MFLYQLIISCWLADITDSNTVKSILSYAISKYKVFHYRKNTKVTDHTLWVFIYHIRKHIPELRMIDDTIYGMNASHNSKNTPAFKIILTLERLEPSNPYNPIFRKMYPTDSILQSILKEIEKQ